MARTMGRGKRWRGVWLLLVLLGVAWLIYDRWRVYRENSQDEVILAAAARYGVDAALIKAVVWRESWFNPWARGRHGEIGLMQVGELAAREWAAAEQLPRFVHSQLFDPAQNTQAGTWYLRQALRRYPATDNPLPYALAEYNAGRANVVKWLQGAAATNSAAFLDQIGFPGTKRYVTAVLHRYEHYRRSFPPAPR